jgi:hypothetical protein
MVYKELPVNILNKSKKYKTFIILSLIYISLISLILFTIFKNYIKLTKEKIIF